MPGTKKIEVQKHVAVPMASATRLCLMNAKRSPSPSIAAHGLPVDAMSTFPKFQVSQ